MKNTDRIKKVPNQNKQGKLKKTFTIMYSSLKGGTGKSSLVIMTANALGKAGFKILVIDSDLNNSTTFSYISNSLIISEKNYARAIQSNDLVSNIIKTSVENVDLIASSLFLADLRALSTNRLVQMIKQVYGLYDFVCIDSSPSYDNIVLNGINAADMIITPVNFSQFDINTCLFMKNKLQEETTKYDNWFLLYNGYSDHYAKNDNSSQSEYIRAFESYFENILPVHVPFCSAVRKYIDRDEVLSLTEGKDKLLTSICQLATIIAKQEINLKSL